MENKHKANKNFFLHVYELFKAQSLPTKLLIIGVLITALALPAILSPVLVKADTYGLILSPVDDGHVNKSDTNENYGTDDEIKSDKDRTAYLKFNLASLAGQPVARAELRMYVAEDSKIAHILKGVPNTSWKEKTLVYKNRPAVSGPEIAVVGPAPKGQMVSIDVTNDVIAHLGQFWSVAIESPRNSSDSLYFYSKDNKSKKPELVIEFAGNVTPTVMPQVTAIPNVTVMPTTARPTTAPTVRPSAGALTPTLIATITRMPTVTKTPTTAVPTSVVMNTPTTAPVGGQYPAQVLDLTNWKITLPTGSSGAEEIKQPALATFRVDPWFVVNSGGGVRFRAPVNGVTTSGSGYPRSELREMTSNGTGNASWSTSSGVHTMYIDQAITAVPITKKHVVAGQIHDAGDDVIVIRLEGSKLFVDIAGADGPTLDAAYTLGKRFQVRFEVSNGQTRIYYKPNTSSTFTLAYTLNRSYSGAYFKAGAYTQSNCSTESGNCSDSNYGEVVIYGLQVTHQ